MAMGDIGTVAVFLVSAALFMHVAARFVLGQVAPTRSLAVVGSVAAVAGGVAALGPPTVLAALTVAVAAAIAVQVAYDVALREAVLVLGTYAVLTAIVGGVLRAALRLL